MSPAFLEDERIVDLLVEGAIDGWSPVSSEELVRLSREHGDFDADVIDRIAAAVAISGLRPEPVPPRLQRRLAEAADCWSGRGQGAAEEVAQPADSRSTRDSP
jgi:hypothetical protein